MKKIFLLTVFLTISYLGFAQTKHSIQDSIKKYKRINIVEIGDRDPVVTRYLFLDPHKIVDLSSLSNAANAELRALLKVDFVLIVKFDADTKLLTLNDVLKLYKINTLFWNLPVMVDDEQIADPQTILIARNQIEKVAIVKKAGGSIIQITLIE